MAETHEATMFEMALLTAENEALKAQLAELTMTPEPTKAPKKVKKAPKAPKAAPKAAPKDQIVRSANLIAFGDAIGVDFRVDDSEAPWTLTDLLDSLREYREIGVYPDNVLFYPDNDLFQVVGMPKGWTFGPKALNYLATGEFE